VTLRGLEEIVTSLKDLDFNFLLTRNINQDPLENFSAKFGSIVGETLIQPLDNSANILRLC
jgi:hypothetical protein